MRVRSYLSFCTASNHTETQRILCHLQTLSHTQGHPHPAKPKPPRKVISSAGSVWAETPQIRINVGLKKRGKIWSIFSFYSSAEHAWKLLNTDLEKQLLSEEWTCIGLSLGSDYLGEFMNNPLPSSKVPTNEKNKHFIAFPSLAHCNPE